MLNRPGQGTFLLAQANLQTGAEAFLREALTFNQRKCSEIKGELPGIKRCGEGCARGWFSASCLPSAPAFINALNRDCSAEQSFSPLITATSKHGHSYLWPQGCSRSPAAQRGGAAIRLTKLSPSPRERKLLQQLCSRTAAAAPARRTSSCAAQLGTFNPPAPKDDQHNP